MSRELRSYQFLLLNSDTSKVNETHSDEEWVITLVGSRFSWSSPSKLNEESIAVDISQIREIKKSYNDRDDSSPYIFFMINGITFKPEINSFMNIEELIEIFEERGIVCERVSSFSKYNA